MDSNKAPLRIAVIGGSGLIGKRHCQHVALNPSTHLVAIVDPGAAAQDVADTYSAALYPSIEALLKSPDKPDAAIVCTPNHTHVALASQLADAGLHIFCEKPISTTIDSAQALIDTAKKNNVRLLVGHHRRFNPYMLATKAIFKSGVIGQVTAVSGLWTAVKPAGYFAGVMKWRQSKDNGGGVVLINFIHEIDLMHYLFGPVTRIHAEKSISRRPQHADSAEEGAAITLRFASGVVGTFVLLDNVASPHNFEGGTGENPMIPKTGRDVYRIFGSNGTLSVPDMMLSTYGANEATWTQSMDVKRVEVENAHIAPFDSQLNHFVQVCRGDEKPSCTGEEGLRALVVCEAIRKALDMPGGGGTVDIESPEMGSTQ